MKRKTYLRLAILTGFVLGGLWLVPLEWPQRAQTATSFEKTIQPFVTENCVYCHNAKKQSGGAESGGAQYRRHAELEA